MAVVETGLSDRTAVKVPWAPFSSTFRLLQQSPSPQAVASPGAFVLWILHCPLTTSIWMDIWQTSKTCLCPAWDGHGEVFGAHGCLTGPSPA